MSRLHAGTHSKHFSANYSRFALSIITSPDAMERMLKSPARAMKGAGLTKAEMSLILSGDQDAILSKVNPKYAGKVKSKSSSLKGSVKVLGYYFCCDKPPHS